MSHLTVKDEVVRDDQNSQKWTKEMEEVGGSCPANTKETPTKKVKAEGSAKCQLISKCPSGVVKSTKKATEFL